MNDIGTALRYIDEDFGSRMDDLDSLLKYDEITFELLWALFPPKETIFASRHGVLQQDQALYLSQTAYSARENQSKYFNVTGDVISHDGEDFGWATLDIEIDEYEGAKKIDKLPVYPFAYHTDSEKIKSTLLARGHKYISLVQKPICQEYNATTALKLETMPNGSSRFNKIAVSIFKLPMLANSDLFSGTRTNHGRS